MVSLFILFLSYIFLFVLFCYFSLLCVFGSRGIFFFFSLLSKWSSGPLDLWTPGPSVLPACAGFSGESDHDEFQRTNSKGFNFFENICRSSFSAHHPHHHQAAARCSRNTCIWFSPDEYVEVRSCRRSCAAGAA